MPKKGGKNSPETRAKISKSMKGHYVSPETRRKISLAQRGEKHHMYGKKHTAEVRRKIKMSLAQLKLNRNRKRSSHNKIIT